MCLLWIEALHACEMVSTTQQGTETMELFSAANQQRIGVESHCLSFLLNTQLGDSHLGSPRFSLVTIGLSPFSSSHLAFFPPSQFITVSYTALNKYSHDVDRRDIGAILWTGYRGLEADTGD